MHRYYALIYYAIGKFEGFDTFMLTLKRSFVKCFFTQKGEVLFFTGVQFVDDFLNRTVFPLLVVKAFFL